MTSIRIWPMRVRWRPWVFLMSLALTVATILLVAISIGEGDYPLSPWRVLQLLSGAPGREIEQAVVFGWRLPRALTGVAAGAALGIAGAIFQNVTRNPLASPDILGITAGASAAAVTVITLGSSSSNALVVWLAEAGIPLAALCGAVITALAMWMLAWKRGIDTYRLVLYGIVISALLHAYIRLLLVRAHIRDAATAQLWLSGSIANASWQRSLPLFVLVIVIVPVLAWATFTLSALALGDTTAVALGLRLGPAHAGLLGLAVALTAVAVSAAGPIGFIAFVAPQVALRLSRRPTPPLYASAATGSVLLLLADIITRLLPRELPVGLVTSTIGGIFLIYILIHQSRKVGL
ncbi:MULTISPECIES: iron chelate uptake ABC transporter family permease subunit [Corynebacterium]|uniref:FecCD family ABC transporter permease n=1 Tax=Corynebacterium TaxID=1716 RepID=UPI00124CD3BC|nr:MULTISPECIES: iron chelate uptake ABC transporter family permease subunit [Corynebacterium]